MDPLLPSDLLPAGASALPPAPAIPLLTWGGSSLPWLEECAAATPGLEILPDLDACGRRLVDAGRALVLIPADLVQNAEWRRLAEYRRLAPQSCWGLVSSPQTAEWAFCLARRLSATLVLPHGCWRHAAEWAAWLRWSADPASTDFMGFYLGADAHIESFHLRHQEERLAVHNRVSEISEHASVEQAQRYDFRLIFEEVLNNAALHAFSSNQAASRGERLRTLSLSGSEGIQIRLGENDHLLAFTIADTGGRLARQTVLDHIYHHLASHGLLDESGRGLYLAYRLAKRVFFRLVPDSRTEIHALFYKHRSDGPPNAAELDPHPLLIID